MTVAEAYRVIGTTADSGAAEIDQLYRARLRKLQLQLIPGNSVVARQKAQRQVAELAEAWEVLQKHGLGRSGRKRQRLPDYRKNVGTATATWPPPRMVEAGIGFAIAAAIMCVVTSMCLTQTPLDRVRERKTTYAESKKEVPAVEQKPATAPITPISQAMVRVLSVPWCEVELDGRPFGASGQSVAFETSEGTHTLVLHRNGKVLTKEITLQAGRLSIIKIDFEREQIHVEQQ